MSEMEKKAETLGERAGELISRLAAVDLPDLDEDTLSDMSDDALCGYRYEFSCFATQARELLIEFQTLAKETLS